MSKLSNLLRSRLRPVVVPIRDEIVESALLAAQNDISASCPTPYYAETYRHVEREYWEHALRWLPRMKKDIRVADVGAAYGTLAVMSKRLLNADVTCVDAIETYYPKPLFEREGIRHVMKHVEIDDLASLGKFDLIIFTEVLEHLNFKPQYTLRKLKDALRPGGRLILTTPDADAWGRTTKYYPSLDALPDPDPSKEWIDDHIWQFSDQELFQVLDESGFKIEEFALSPASDPRHLNVLCSRREDGAAKSQRLT